MARPTPRPAPPPASPGAPADVDGLSRYEAPTTLEQAARLLAGGEASVIAGGTDLMVNPHGPWTRRPLLVNIRRIEGLRGAEVGEREVRIGALTTVTDVLEDRTLAASAPVLRETADRFASAQIRNMATIGGNICNASPAGDMIIPLLLLDAQVDLVSWDDDKGGLSTRTVALADFFTGPGETVKAASELLAHIRFPLPPAGFVAGFIMSGPRPGLEIALVSMGLGAIAAKGRLSRVRLALGSVAPTPIRARAAEAALEGRPVGEAETVAAAAVEEDIAPISDVRASAWYRRRLIRAFLQELVSHVGHG